MPEYNPPDDEIDEAIEEILRLDFTDSSGSDSNMTATLPSEVDGVEDLRIGPEIEWAMARDETPTFTERGRDSSPVRRDVDSELGPEFMVADWHTVLHGDSTVGSMGAEFSPSDAIHGRDIIDWFEETIELATDISGHGYEPTGLMGDGGTTAGLHLHLSPLSEQMADELWEMSHEPWMQAFTGSSISHDSVKVFRGGRYADLADRRGNYSVVKERRDDDHYEWRLPEPMTGEHFALLIELLDTWLQEGRAAAREQALNLLTQDDSPVTAVRRAEAVGLPGLLEDAFQVTMDRTPHPETEMFYDTVRSLDGVPYSFRATTPDGEYYFFHSFEDEDLSATVEGFDITIEHGTVLDATTLDPVPDDELAAELESALENIEGSRNPFQDGTEVERSDLTDFLLDTAFGE